MKWDEPPCRASPRTMGFQATSPALAKAALSPPSQSADALGQFDDNSLGAAHVAELVDVLVALQLADEFDAAGPQSSHNRIDVFDGEGDMPGVFAAACRLPLRDDGAWYFVSSSRPWPSTVCIIAISARTPSRPTTRSTQRPSTGTSACSSSPSSRKNFVAAARSSTTMPTCSIRWIVMHSIVANPGWPLDLQSVRGVFRPMSRAERRRTARANHVQHLQTLVMGRRPSRWSRSGPHSPGLIAFSGVSSVAMSSSTFQVPSACFL